MSPLAEIDLSRWPDLAQLPTGPRARVSAAIARRLFLTATKRWGVQVRYGPQSTPASGPCLDLVRPEEFFARVGNDGLIGLGEAYLTGAWESDELAETLTVLAAQMPRLVPEWMQRLRGVWARRIPDRLRGTTEQSRGNIAHHYDLSNEMFATFLDPTMTYSSALFEAEVGPGAGPVHSVMAAPPVGADLEKGQIRKIDRLLDATGVGDGTRVLEIGTGWGELALRAARRGAHVHSITLSTEQLELARARAQREGLSDRIEVELRDYRQLDTTRQYDAVVSVEMIEAVGYEFWPEYFSAIDTVLAPGGAAGIQAITMPHDRMLATRDTWTFILKYIFPGGFLPSTEAIEQVTTEHTGLRVSERLSFASHYAETLRQWDQTFTAAEPRWRELGFDGVFGRMWHYYLCYSRAGFASGYLDVQQIVLRSS